MQRTFAIGLAALVLAAAGCARTERTTDGTTPAPSAVSVAAAATVAPVAWCHALPIGFCQAVVVTAPKATLRLAVADTDARREHGLMGVKNVPAGQGMVFVFPDGDKTRGFWMKDTLVPLDMIFVASDGTVMGTAENVAATKPGTPDAKVARRSGVGRYVIELRAGGVSAAGIEPGTHLTLPPIDAQ